MLVNIVPLGFGSVALGISWSHSRLEAGLSKSPVALVVFGEQSEAGRARILLSWGFQPDITTAEIQIILEKNPSDGVASTPDRC